MGLQQPSASCPGYVLARKPGVGNSFSVLDDTRRHQDAVYRGAHQESTVYTQLNRMTTVASCELRRLVQSTVSIATASLPHVDVISDLSSVSTVSAVSLYAPEFIPICTSLYSRSENVVGSDRVNPDDSMLVSYSSQHSSDQKLRDFRPPYLTKNIIIREYLNLGKISRFHLNHFDSENEIVISCPNSSTHV